MRTKRKKSECEIGNGDYDFGVRPINFALLKTYLAESRRIPLRLTNFDGLNAQIVGECMQKKQQ